MPRRLVLVLSAVAALAVPATAVAVNPGSATTKSNQQLNIRIDSPTNGATVPLAALPVRGVATIGPLSGGGGGIPTVMYILDNSGSTSSTAGDCNGDGATNAGDDFNGDSSSGDVLDCEIAGIVSLNGTVKGSGVPNAGVIAFGSAADQGDVGPAGGQQDFTAPAADGNGNGTADVEDVARSVTRNGVGQFTNKTGSGGGTDFDSPLTSMNTAFASQPGRKVAYFLSDGQASVSSSPGGPLDQARQAGTTIYTYSIGSAGAGCQPNSALTTIAQTTGGTCTDVQDPSKLTAIIAGGGGGLSGASINGVAVAANALTPATATLQGSNFTGTIPAAQLRNGTNNIVAAVQASDGTLAQADVNVFVGGRLGASGNSVLPLPSNRRCTSRRAFPIRVRFYRGVRYAFALVFVNGKRVPVYVYRERRRIRVTRIGAVYLNVKRFRAFVDLRGLARGTYRVRVRVVTSNAEVRSNTRRYRTCRGKLRGGIPRL